MADDFKIISRDDPANGAVDIVSQAVRPAFELSPREPHLYDYLLVLRKHQWLILSFMLAVVTIVSIATFRMQPVYVATARIELGRENANILPFQGTDSYDYMLDLENYMETQSKILTSETLALQTLRSGVLTGVGGPDSRLSQRQARPQQPPDGRHLRSQQPRAGRASRQRAHSQLHRSESPQPLRRHHRRHHLAHRPAR